MTNPDPTWQPRVTGAQNARYEEARKQLNLNDLPADIRMFTTEQVAALFNVGILTIRNWRKRGLIKGKKVGRSYYYTAAAIRACAEAD
jgi:hypothetical protein